MYTHKDLTKFRSQGINLFVNLEKCRAQQAIRVLFQAADSP